MTTELLVLSIAIPLSGALAAVISPRHSEGLGMTAVLTSGALVLFLLAQVIVHGPLQHAVGAWSPGLGIALRADILSALLMALTALVVIAGSLFATVYWEKPDIKRHFWPLWLLLVTALYALFLSGDLFNLYVALELLAMAAVTLAAMGGRRAAVDAALRYLLVGLLGSMLYLFGIALLYMGYGTLDLPAVAARIDPGPTTWMAFLLMTGGLLLKTALFPFHFWLPPAHANAPAPVSAVLSALVVKAGFYLILRLWLDLFPGALPPGAGILIGLLGGAAVLWGSWQALSAKRLKLLAAYSTIAQLGYLFIGVALLVQTASGPTRDALFGGLVLLALTHGFAKAGMFLATGVVQRHAGHDRITDLRGMAQRLPLTTFSLALAGIALIGLPASGAFLGKWQLLTGALALGQWPWILIIAAGSLLSSAYVFRIIGLAFGNGAFPVTAVNSVREEWPALLLGMAATLFLGLSSAWLWPLLGDLV